MTKDYRLTNELLNDLTEKLRQEMQNPRYDDSTVGKAMRNLRKARELSWEELNRPACPFR